MDLETIMKTVFEEMNKCSKRFEQCVIEQEQLRGKYTALFDLYKKLKNSTQNTETTTITDTTTDSSAQIVDVLQEVKQKEVKQKEVKQKEVKQEEVKQEEVPTALNITQQDLLDLKQIIDNQDKQKTGKTNNKIEETDIPEYLQEDYKKL